MKRVSRSAIVDCDATAFYELVEDIESYPDFLPWCAAAQVGVREPGRTVATLTLGLKGLRKSFTTENTNVRGRSIDMRLLEGPFKHFAAAWRFTTLQPGAAKVEFSMDYEFSSRALAAALGPAFGRLADGTVEAFTRRAMATRNA
ncbi:MAG: type II toxin-antitoxin system RatA family toxin [Burkholderiales bacterium]